MTDISETVYIVLISGFYETQAKTLSLLTTHIPKERRSFRFNARFYQGLRAAHLKRESHHISHDPDYLLTELDQTDEFSFLPEQTIGGKTVLSWTDARIGRTPRSTEASGQEKKE